MKRLVPAFGVGLVLAIGLGQGDTPIPALSPVALGDGSPYSLAPLPGTLVQVTPPPAILSQLRVSPSVPPARAPGDNIPHSYLVFGLRTGPGGMAFTDRNGAVIPVPSNPQIILKPFSASPVFPPHILPPTTPYHAPKK